MRIVRLAVIGGLLAVAMVGTTGGVAAYGRADHPLAQIEFSANCNDPSFALCQQVGGTGGIWFWVEIDAAQTGDIAGAGCGHVRGGGGGAGSIRGDITWSWSATPTGLPGAFLPPDPNGYYNFTLQGPNGPEPYSFPVTVGHYSIHPVPAVAIEVQVAP